MTNRSIITRLENPTDYYTVESLKRLARDNNIEVRRNINKPDLIRILGDRNLITTTPITAQESNLGVMLTNVPIELIQATKKKARNAREALINFKHFMKNLKCDFLTSSRLKKLIKTLETKERKAKEEHDKILTFRKELSAFNNFTDQYVIDGSNTYDGLSFLMEAKSSIINVLESNRGIKARLYFNCVMRRDTAEGPQRENFYFHSELKIILENTDVEEIFEEMVAEIETAIQKTENAEGSGWVLESIIDIKLYTAEWNPLNAGSYMELPTYLKNKKIINMKNQDDKCFLWCVLRALNPKDNHPKRVDKDLISKQDTLNMKGIKYPVSFRDIDRFESLNPNISITVLGHNENEKVYPLRVSKYTGCEHDIVLMLIRDLENSHYCLVNNLSALLASQLNNHKGARHFCLRCLNSFKCQKSLNDHKEFCYAHECTKINMPEKDTMLKFKNFPHSEKVPFIIYADTEALIKEMHNCDPNPQNSYTKKYQKHEPISFSYYIKCFDNSVCEPILRTYTRTTPEDKDAMKVFIEWLEADVRALANIRDKEMIFTEEDKKRFNKSKECWICREPLNDDKVRDHCHYTGRFRGPAHNKCNLKYRKPKFIPVVFHNLSGYDSHLFIKNLGFNPGTIDCIPNNEENIY